MIQKEEETETEGKRPGSGIKHYEAKSIFLCRVSQETVLHIAQSRSQITYA